MLTKYQFVLFFIIILGCQTSPKPKSDEVASTSKRTNVVLIVVDTLRSDHMGLYGYYRDTTPHLDRWFGGEQVFTHAYSPISFTPPAMASLLSGLYPQHHRVRMAFQKFPNGVPVLPDYLSEYGYQTAAVISNMVLTHEAMGLGNRFDYFDDFVDRKIPIRNAYERNAKETTDAALEWLEKIQTVDEPHFVWLH